MPNNSESDSVIAPIIACVYMYDKVLYHTYKQGVLPTHGRAADEVFYPPSPTTQGANKTAGRAFPHPRERINKRQDFLRYTFSPTFSSRSATETFPSVLAMMIVLPEVDGPNSLVKSTLIVRIFPSTDMSTFFKRPSLCLRFAF